MSIQWITVKEAALCSNVSVWTIYKKIHSGKLEYKCVNGTKFRIPLESLPQEAQTRYRQFKHPFTLTEAELYKLLTLPQLEEVMEKLLAVTMYRTYLAQHNGIDCRKEFLKFFSQRYSYINVDEDKLKTWFDKFNTFGAAGLAEKFILCSERDDST